MVVDFTPVFANRCLESLFAALRKNWRGCVIAIPTVQPAGQGGWSRHLLRGGYRQVRQVRAHSRPSNLQAAPDQGSASPTSNARSSTSSKSTTSSCWREWPHSTERGEKRTVQGVGDGTFIVTARDQPEEDDGRQLPRCLAVHRRSSRPETRDIGQAAELRKHGRQTSVHLLGNAKAYLMLLAYKPRS